MRKGEPTVFRERALLVGVFLGRERPEDFHRLEELRSLAETAGAHIEDGVVQRLNKVEPRTYIGSGKVEEIAERIREKKVHVVIIDRDLSPAQGRNLEQLWGCRVIDRTELILDIFATHARSSQSKLQVELAQLEYAMPRLRRMWTHLGQQVGGAVTMGIGTRGPGEKQLEVDRRLARDRIAALRRELAQIERRKVREVSSRAQQYYTVSLVGYTNAGKSTLMNRLTSAEVYVDDKLFSTLDTRTRLWQLQNGLKVLLSDTVGFIRDLPHDLVASFHATLEEVSQADLLLHVVDAAHADVLAQIQAVQNVLDELGCAERETILVLNKIDRLEEPLHREILKRRFPQAVLTSAASGDGMESLEEQVAQSLAKSLVEVDLTLPIREGRTISEIHEVCQVLDKRFENGTVMLRVRAPKRLIPRFQRFSNGSSGM